MFTKLENLRLLPNLGINQGNYFKKSLQFTVRIRVLDKLNLVKLDKVLGLSQFLLLPQEMMLASKVVKNDSKIIIFLHKYVVNIFINGNSGFSKSFRLFYRNVSLLFC